MKTSEQRRNIYAYSLLGSILAIAIVGLLNVWQVGIEASITYKVIGSFIIVASLSAFLYALSFNHDIKLIEKLGNLTGILAVALSAVILLQIWFEAFQEAFFLKITVTIVILAALSAFVIAIFDDFLENKKFKDENYLD